jgi:ABC-2 type transport system permease protein
MSIPRTGSLAGTVTLMRHIVRRDRFRLIIWIAVAVFISTATYGAYEGLYPTMESRQGLQSQLGASPSLALMYGPAFDLMSAGGFIAWRVGLYTALVLAIFAILTVVRQTRAEEDAQRAEMLASGVVGRYAMLAAAMAVVVGTMVVAGLLIVAVLISYGADAVGSIAFAGAAVAYGAVFTAVAAVAVQLGSYSRAANGIAFGALGLAYVVRGWGDATDHPWASWLSPMGWVSQVRAFAGNRWEIFLLFAGLFVVLVSVAALLVRRRDIGMGLIKPREGRAEAGAALHGVFGLAWRMQRGLLIGWAVAFVAFGVILGSLATAFDELVGDNEQAKQIIERMGGTGQLSVLYVAAILPIIGVIAVLYGVAAMLRTRTEETEGRLEPLLATPVSRWHWFASHLLMALGGSALLVILGGGTIAAVASATVPDGAVGFWEAFQGALIQIPATWLIIAISAALVGVAPRFTGFGWAAAGVALAITWLGAALGLPDAALKISPFENLPRVPGQELTATPLLIIGALVVALLVVASLGLRRRDIGV